ncbi:MAG: hypothetical protein KF685_12160 [Acidobacteria bacterium]|nr:hypothetical protein [Acidobacteriota bacterium]
MSQMFESTMSKAKEASFLKKLDGLLTQLRENNQATLEIRKEIAQLKRSNDRSFNRAKKAVDALAKN